MALPTIIILGLLASGIPAITCRFASYENEIATDADETEIAIIPGENKTVIAPIGNLVPTGSITAMSNRGRVTKKFTCPAIYGRYPHPESCEYYFECRFGWPTLWHCNRGYLYDKEKEQCRDKRKVKCHIGHERDYNHKDDKDKELDVKEDGQFKCPYIWGTFAHPYDCSKYYVCVYNYPKLFQCYRNFLYDTHIRKCLPSKNVNCGNRLDRDQIRTSKRPVVRTTTVKPVEITVVPPKNTKFHCPFPYGRYPDPEDCSRFYECRFSIPQLHTCPESTLYHERKELCLDKKRVKCGVRPGGNDEDVEPEEDKTVDCPYVWGTFAHPVDCSKYVICIYNVPSIFNCRKNELFDAHYRRCLPKEKVTCDGRINPDDQHPSGKTTTSPTSKTLTPSTERKFSEPSTRTVSTTTSSTTTTVYTITTTTPTPTTTTITTPVPPTTTPTPTTTTTTTPVPTTTTTTTTTTPVPTTTTTTPSPTTITTTKLVPTTTTSIPTTTTTTSAPTTTSPKPRTVPTLLPVTKPNTPPPTGCREDDLDCIIDETGDVSGWFECPKRFGHFPHGSSKQLFIHCDNWRPYVKKCAEHTEFSPVYLVCVWGNRKYTA